MATAIAVRYARALAEVVVAPGSPVDGRAAVTQLQAFEAVLAESLELRHVLHSPAVSASRKRAVIATFAAQLGVHDVVRNMLWILSDHHRISLVKEVRESLDAVVDEKLGMVKAEVASAAPMAQDVREQLAKALAGATGKAVRCEYAEESSLLGGVQVKIGSKIFDGSVRAQLDDLRRRMISNA